MRSPWLASLTVMRHRPFSRAAKLYDRWEATVEVATEHADFFIRNLVAILAEERVALTINRPDLLIIGTFAPA